MFAVNTRADSRLERVRDAITWDDSCAAVAIHDACIAGREVVIDYLDRGQFAPLCRDLRGDLIDAVSAVPELPYWDDA